MMNDKELDNLLNAPLAAIPDAGFSSRVLSRIARAGTTERVTTFALIFVCAVPVLLFVPLPAIFSVAAQLFVKATLSPILAIAAAALILTFSADSILSRN